MIYKRNNIEVTEISWIAPTEREDATPYTAAEHAGYELGVSVNGGGYTPWVDVPAAYDVTSWPLNELNLDDEGIYEIAMRTLDINGLESAWSNPLVITVSFAVPKPPAGLNAS